VEAIRSSEMSAHTRPTRRHIPEDGIIHSHHCEKLKSHVICITLPNFINKKYLNFQRKIFADL
jgi:hypothetical protein